MRENTNLVPRRRFKEFQNTGAWEQRKLGNIVDIRSGRDYKHLSEGEIPVYGTGGYMLSVNEALSYKEDAIGIGRKGTIDKPYILRAPFWTVDTLFYGIPETNSDLDFIYDIFQNINWKQKDESTGVPSLSKTAINAIDVLVPEYKEQKIIGNFFKNLDTLITLHQHKLEKIKSLKSAYLSEMFPAEGEREPKRRFAGFSDDWEHQKLKQLANFAKGQGYSKNDLTEVGTPIILYGRLYTKYQSTISEVDTFAVPQSGSVYSTGEEVIVPASGETAEDIARASAVVKAGFLLGGDLNIIYPKKDIRTIFLALSISNGKQRKELSKKAQGKSVVHLHNSDLEDIIISFPCREEQERIGRVFVHLDNLITTHQCKLEKLQSIKKAYLNEMFI